MATKKIAKGHFKKLPPSLQPQTKTPVGKLVWKRIRKAGFTDYEISSTGMIRRREKTLPLKHALRVLVPNQKNKLYPRVTLTPKKGPRKSFMIHQLLAGEFLRPKKPGEVIRHLDARPQTPTAWTIAWGSAKANRNDHELHQLFFAMINPDPKVLARAALLIDVIVLKMPKAVAAKKWHMTIDTIKDLARKKRNRVELEFLWQVINTWKSR